MGKSVNNWTNAVQQKNVKKYSENILQKIPKNGEKSRKTMQLRFFDIIKKRVRLIWRLMIRAKKVWVRKSRDHHLRIRDFLMEIARVNREFFGAHLFPVLRVEKRLLFHTNCSSLFESLCESRNWGVRVHVITCHSSLIELLESIFLQFLQKCFQSKYLTDSCMQSLVCYVRTWLLSELLVRAESTLFLKPLVIQERWRLPG